MSARRIRDEVGFTLIELLVTVTSTRTWPVAVLVTETLGVGST